MKQPEPHGSPRRRAWVRWAPLALLLVFWWVSIWNLGRYPLIEEDEPWILSPGFKLFAQGVYGSNLLRGFHGMDQHYFEFMPLMAWLQGALSRLLGVGVLQMRWLPVVLGALTLTLTFALARRLTTPSAGLGAILAAWQARRTGRGRYDLLSGALGGLAGLAHLYGLFWLGAALLLRLAEPQGFSVRRALRAAVLMLAGAAAPWGRCGWAR